MNVERLRRIIAYSGKNRGETNSKVKKFCSLTGLEYENDVLNILQIVRSSFQKNGYLAIEMPFADDEIGALCYKGDGLGYVVLNTSLPKVNVNFAIAHEAYHIFFQDDEFVSKVEFSNDHYYEHEEEYAANHFAGTLLMPEISLRRMYHKFKAESEGNELDTFIRLMAYYQVPYMAVLIRCYELDLPEDRHVSADLLNMDRKKIEEKFEELWLDNSILHATKRDDYMHIEAVVEKFGRKYIEEGYLNERTLAKVKQNMRELYQEIRGK